LSFNPPFLRYANEAVYPFYILHQTVIIILGYQLAYTNWGIGLKFPLVVAATFLICWGIYALAIRPWNIARVAFGMKWRRVRLGDRPQGEGVPSPAGTQSA
jgi:peptidoglycan/LPS O-acetylase OafA/YrhL